MAFKYVSFELVFNLCRRYGTVFDALDEEMPVETYDGISLWTTEGHWRFQLGDDDAPGGFCDLLREKATDPELAIKEWKALKGRLEPLYDALDACPAGVMGLLHSTHQPHTYEL